MSASSSQPGTTTKPDLDIQPRLLPPFHVILENDEFHSMEFVIDTLRKVLGVSIERAYQLMMTAHESGQAIIWTGPKEVAELKYEQVIGFHEKRSDGRDLGPLGCRIEPAV
ncbi:ATP-dependent Clp protease adaptor ClpS [Tuwongella immobilis]|uniref:ATP-dependent Clp protease adapter protein ClpS n=1 Tax=Tuwongella immobilis TaxID=692036 RepID=A0A6C2YK45_9BACT|nr:ATP-dependent Clp protease adaptor ClpS [Tuwongella immobilis]VIP01796.1 clp protease : ATP-dependent Clp protease adapter protein ClpS OS=Singulisphaera acidiphila (strain ATCC BAA-1392 / DSM 18658 / VKM B-2454 / MOB10) GN=clpS PE=3 SV=1: ClpS [Tuwongella immobilis]VTR99477.1 clp protease : ATP-dependent Clp protease adapter protein ClpS OS=Singulisphaera acidiphila (strain ATCC BAA-1392 / DSM 18658 / VKM B-2454 / MOB10) GN=clpS PE=3 SV=1: ClpS [Tuwongella immobilis]